MQTIYLELPGTYQEMLKPLDQFGGLDYYQHHETVDRYIEHLVRMEVYRRQCPTEIYHVKEWFKEIIAGDPISDDYFINQVIQMYIVQSSDMWRSVERELTFTPISQFMMWPIDFGLWKMIAAGVKFYVK